MKTRNILLIEDDPTDAELTRIYLRSASGEYKTHLHHEATFYGGLAALGERQFDLILMDLGLPDVSWREGMETISRLHRDIPVVIVTGFEDEERRKRAMKLGAQEYLIKDRFDSHVLQRAIDSTINRFNFQKQLQEVFDMAGMFYWIYDPEEKELELPISVNGHKQMSDIRHIGLEEFLKPMPDWLQRCYQNMFAEIIESGTDQQLEYQLENAEKQLENWVVKLRLKGDSKKIIGLSIRK